MYAIRRGKDGSGQFLTDGPVYVDGKYPSPLWQHLEGDRIPYLESSLRSATARRDRLQKIYTAHELVVVRLTDDQLEYITFRKLRNY